RLVGICRTAPDPVPSRGDAGPAPRRTRFPPLHRPSQPTNRRRRLHPLPRPRTMNPFSRSPSRLLGCVLAALFPALLDAQQNWTPVFPQEELGLAVSTVNREWDLIALPEMSRTNALAKTGESLLAVGTSGVLRSTDGRQWQQTASTTELWSVARGAGKLVAVGRIGTVRISEDDGLTWSTAASETPSHLYGVTFGDGRFVAVGADGAVVTSQNGVDWVPQTSGGTQILRSVAYG